MARPEIEPVTELAKRLREVRLAMGFKERKQFAEYLGISASTLGNYETGRNEPIASALTIYKTTCNVSLDWLMTGAGEMFQSAATAPTSVRAVSPKVMETIASRVEDVFKDLVRKPTKGLIAKLATEIYNSLLASQIDFEDVDELNTAIQLAAIKLKKQIIKETEDDSFKTSA